MSKCWYCNEELTTANYCDEHIGICTKCYGSMFKVSNDFVKGLTDKISDLEAKLAEKDEEIKDLNYRLDLKFVNYTNSESIKFLEDQDKISFAVEQLEKVKEACKEIPQCDEYGDDWVLQSGLTEYIDNQIEELKKEMK